MAVVFVLMYDVYVVVICRPLVAAIVASAVNATGVDRDMAARDIASNTFSRRRAFSKYIKRKQRK